MKRTFLLASLALVTSTWAQRSPFTGVEVVPPDSTGHYRLLIGGHFHGASNNRSGFPAATVLANLDTINTSGANVLLSTGDLFLDAEADLDRYRKALFSRLRLPLFNAPGNHDTGAAYRQAFGDAHQVIAMGDDRIVLLDTERDNGSITGDQLATLRALAEVGAGRVFIISHRPIWAEVEPTYGPLFAGNTRSALPTNYRKEVWPVVERMAQRGAVYWISGSMAGRAPASIFFQPHGANITFIQSAIRDEPRDALLIADVGPDGIRWQGLSLTGLTLEPVERYDATWWQDKQGRPEPFNWRLLPYRVSQILFHWEFWMGMAVCMALVMLYHLLQRRRSSP